MVRVGFSVAKRVAPIPSRDLGRKPCPRLLVSKARYGPVIHYDPKGPGPDGESLLAVALFSVIGAVCMFGSVVFGLVLLACAGYILWNEMQESKPRWEGFTRMRTAYWSDRNRLLGEMASTLGRTSLPRAKELAEPNGVVPPVMPLATLIKILAICGGIVALVYAIAYLSTHRIDWTVTR